METNRNQLADKMEIIGQVFEIDGMTELLNKYEHGMSNIKFNAVTIQVSALLLRENKPLADKIIALATESGDKDVQKLDDPEYALALRNAIIRDVMGFFVSSQHTAGK